MDVTLREAIFAQVKKIPLTESGLHVSLTAAHLGEEVEIAKDFLLRYPDGGILYIGATTGLEQSMLNSLLHERMLDAKHLALFGIHAWTASDAFLRAQGVQSYSMLEISREGLNETTDAVMAFVREWPRFHLIINLDALDPAFAPGLQAPKGGGFTMRELLYVVQRVRLIRSCVSVEVVVDAAADLATMRAAAQVFAECTAP